jgi:hypothetical protein
MICRPGLGHFRCRLPAGKVTVALERLILLLGALTLPRLVEFLLGAAADRWCHAGYLADYIGGLAESVQADQQTMPARVGWGNPASKPALGCPKLMEYSEYSGNDAIGGPNLAVHTMNQSMHVGINSLAECQRAMCAEHYSLCSATSLRRQSTSQIAIDPNSDAASTSIRRHRAALLAAPSWAYDATVRWNFHNESVGKPPCDH